MSKNSGLKKQLCKGWSPTANEKGKVIIHADKTQLVIQGDCSVRNISRCRPIEAEFKRKYGKRSKEYLALRAEIRGRKVL